MASQAAARAGGMRARPKTRRRRRVCRGADSARFQRTNAANAAARNIAILGKSGSTGIDGARSVRRTSTAPTTFQSSKSFRGAAAMAAPARRVLSGRSRFASESLSVTGSSCGQPPSAVGTRAWS
ncbi:MAG: hypothetical protein AMS21_05790 [Gemmatimonas sp. SG8_38_2]|nr:MAG: hypothetical protein AMS21_05790 [Gemmatimonas sp. SG8_38_2]